MDQPISDVEPKRIIERDAPAASAASASSASSATPLKPPRPTVAFMMAHPAHLIALGFGSGMGRIAPGTVGTLWGWLSFLMLQLWLSPAQIGWLLPVAGVVGWWACTVTARDMRVADPGHIVWDEVLAMWIILWLTMPMGFWGQLIAFALFRFFDAVKPQPVKWADQLFKGFGWKGGFGIMFDDLVAAFCTLLTIAVWRHFFH